MLFIPKIPGFITKIFFRLRWRFRTQRKVLYLTFDDGPVPEVTPWVLDTLAKYNAKATFFCVGDNVNKHEPIFQQIVTEGHAVGNHTFNHLNGSRTRLREYLRNVSRCSEVVRSSLFRPPYGRMSIPQKYALLRRYRIVMWDVLSGDYDHRFSPQQCFQHVVRNAKPGSIIVMHDSRKAEHNLRHALPDILEHFNQQGFSFESIDEKRG